MGILKRAKDSSDIKIIADLARTIYIEHYEPIVGIKQVEYMLDKFQSEKAIKEQIKNNTIYDIIYHENQPCGYFAVEINEPKGKLFLSKFYILKNKRGLGLGNILLNEIKKIAIDNNLSTIWLHVNKNNPTKEIYIKMGFKIAQSVKDPIGGGFYMDDYLMELAVKEK